MKQKILVPVLSLLVVIMGGFYYVNTQSQPVTEEGKNVEVASKVEVTPLSPDVSVSTSTDWSVIAEPSGVADGSKIKTSPDGRAIVTNGTDIVSSLDNNTEITLALAADNKQTKLNVASGRVWSKIARALEQDEAFEVYTPTMVAAVRGTSFGVSLDSKRVLVVAEGTVRVNRLDPETGEVIPGTEIDVTAGNTLEDDGTKFTIRITTQEDRDNWYEEHNPVVEVVEVATPSTNQQPVNRPVTATNPTTDTAQDPAPEQITPTTPVPVTSEPEPPSIRSVSPDEFDSETQDNIRIDGANLATVTDVLLNGDPVEFIITSTGLIVINTSELRDGYDTYDVTVTSPSGTDTLNEAFINEFQGIALTITSSYFEFNASESSIIVIEGTGLSEVDTVLVANEIVPFNIVSDTRINVNNQFTEPGVSVEVRAGSENATGIVSQ